MMPFSSVFSSQIRFLLHSLNDSNFDSLVRELCQVVLLFPFSFSRVRNLYLELASVVASNSISLSSKLICGKTLDYYCLIFFQLRLISSMYRKRGEVNFFLFFCFCSSCCCDCGVCVWAVFSFNSFSDEQWKLRLEISFGALAHPCKFPCRRFYSIYVCMHESSVVLFSGLPIQREEEVKVFSSGFTHI